MRRIHWVLLVVWIAFVGGGLPADAKTEKYEFSELRSTTRIVGDSTASIRVRLTHSVKLTPPDASGMSPDIRISGGGRLAGVTLIAEDWEGGLLHEDLLIADRWGICQREGCTPETSIFNFRGLKRDKAGRAILEAGDYTLHLLADGEPVRVTLRLDGAPPGRTVLRPTGPSSVDFQSPEMTVAQDANGMHIYGAGNRYRSGSVGVSASMLYVKASRGLDSFSGGICQINTPTGPPPVAYGPQCYALTAAGLGKGFYLINETVEDREFVLLPLISYHDQGIQPPNVDGNRGLGGWVATQYELDEFRFMGFFVEAP